MDSPLQQRIAGTVDLGESEPFQLFAGEAPIITENFTAGADLQAYQVFALNSSGLAVPHDPSAGSEEEPSSEAVAVGITAYAVDTAEGANNVPFGGYTGGFFNHESLVWNAALTTFEERRAAFGFGKTIKIGQLLGN